ncbi:MAG: sensor histidine kinase [Candidatus Cyclobacteriaceae bacterium M3_2C_046]
MRLIYKLSIMYLAASIIVFAFGGFVTYIVINREVDLEEQRFLQERLEQTLRFISHREPTKSFSRDKISIIPLGESGQEKPITFSDTLVMHSTLQRPESHIKLDVVKEVKGKYYAISMYDLIVEEDDIADGVVESVLNMLGILVVILLILSFLASKILLKPFEMILAQIRAFDLRDNQNVTFPRSSTKELQQLSEFLGEMTHKIKNDYRSLKEFTENASHEMQTPLSIANGKLELLMEDNDLRDEQLQLITAAQTSLRRLSTLGSSLTLLTKIDNFEFRSTDLIDASQIIKQHIYDFQELIEMRQINLDFQVQDQVMISVNPSLLQIMFTNLIKNAINHNFKHSGEIYIELNQDQFIIKNTGKDLKVPPEKLFERFIKESDHHQSLGLGLSIVKKICEVSHFTIQYQFNKPYHLVKIIF